MSIDFTQKSDICRGTLAQLDQLNIPPILQGLLKDPKSAESALTPSLISRFAESSYVAWTKRKEVSGEVDIRVKRSFSDLPVQEKEFITNLATGKLAYLVSFVTKQGIEELVRIGKLGGTLLDVSFDSPVDVRDILARLHHDHCTNLNAELRRVTPWNYEWGKHPPEKAHGYELQRIQADMDCQAIASLPLKELEHLLGLAIPSDTKRFFHEGVVLNIRSNKPAQASDAGHEFSVNRDKAGILKLIDQLARHPDTEIYYESHAVMDGLEVSQKDRAIIEGTLYRNNGVRGSRDDARNIISKFINAPYRDLYPNRKYPDLSVEEILNGIDLNIENRASSLLSNVEFRRVFGGAVQYALKNLKSGFTAGFLRLESDAQAESVSPPKVSLALACLSNLDSLDMQSMMQLGKKILGSGVVGGVNFEDSFIALYSGESLSVPDVLFKKMQTRASEVDKSFVLTQLYASSLAIALALSSEKVSTTFLA